MINYKCPANKDGRCFINETECTYENKYDCETFRQFVPKRPLNKFDELDKRRDIK